MVGELGPPLAAHILERRRGHEAEAYEKDVGLRVRQRTQAVVILLAGRVPEAKGDVARIDSDAGSVVLKDCRDIVRRELAGGVGDEQTRLADSTVADDDAWSAGQMSAEGARSTGWRTHT